MHSKKNTSNESSSSVNVKTLLLSESRLKKPNQNMKKNQLKKGGERKRDSAFK